MVRGLGAGLPAALLLTAACLTATAQAQQKNPHARLFPPYDLGLLEAPDRDFWQQPDRVMDALGVAEGSQVADIGAGAGWFTIRLARRVGPNGRVFAEDVQPEMLAAISRRAKAEGLANVIAVQGTNTDPKLPPGSLHAILLVDVYAEMESRVKTLQNIASALQPTGRLGIVEWNPGDGGPGPVAAERIDAAVVISEAAQAGLRLLSREALPYQYVLIFSRDTKGRAPAG